MKRLGSRSAEIYSGSPETMVREGFDAGSQPELPRLDENNIAALPPGDPAPQLEPPQSIFAPVQEDTDLSVAARSPSQTSEAADGSLVSRAQRKSQALRDYFGLPADEVGCLHVGGSDHLNVLEI